MRILNKRIFILFILLILGGFGYFYLENNQNPHIEFDNGKAYDHIVEQLSFGARYPGSDGHKDVQDYIISTMNSSGWDVNLQKANINGFEIENIICELGSGDRVFIFGAHYDTRKFANNENGEFISEPVMGANDGASGVAVLLELARVLPKTTNTKFIIIFFDQEDNGGIDGADWSMGSEYYVEQMNFEPEAVVIVDMVGDADLNIFREMNSSIELSDDIWGVANNLGYDEFLNQEKYNLIDDHLPFVKKGHNAILIIDFEYDYWHTTEDTIGNVSSESLGIVGDTILNWIYQELENEKK